MIALNGENVAKIEKAEKIYFTDPSRAVSFVAAGVFSLVMPVLLDDNNFNYLESRYFKAPTDGARVDVLKGIISEPQDTTNEAAPVAIESQDTNESEPAAVVPEPATVDTTAATVADIEKESEPESESEPATAADGLQLISINETTGEIIWSRADDDTTNENEPAAVLAANFAARARRWFAVAAAVLALFIVGATTNESGAPSSLPMVTPQDTARAIVATVADVETESEPQDTNESATTPAKASHRTPRARRAAKLAPVAIADTLTADTVRAIVADVIERQDTAAAVVPDTLTTDTTTAAPVAIVADDIESHDTTNDDDAPAVIVADGDNETESEPATVADDDTNDDGNGTSTTGTTTTGNGATTGTTTAPAPVPVVIVGGVPVPVWLLML